MRRSASRLTMLALTAGLAVATTPTAWAQDQAAVPDPADTGYTVRIGFPSGNREATASSPADIWAQHLGIFDEVFGPVGVTLQYEPFLGAGPAINEALIAGSLDVANYADTAGVLGKTAGADTSLVAIDDPFTPAWLVVPEASDIASVEDLRGRKVATIKATFPHRFLLSVLAANGLSEQDIEFINLSLPDSEVALDGGQIDAAVTLGPNAPRLLGRGYRPIATIEDVPEAAGVSVFAATNPFIAAHPSFFPAYLAARDRAVAWAKENPEEAYAVLAESAKSTVEEAQQLYPAFDFTSTLSPEIVERISQTDQFLVDQGLSPSPLDVSAWIAGAAASVAP